MIYTNLIKKALKLCYEVHQKQVDKANIPYVFHPFYLAMQMDSEEEIIVALLHDVIEDSNYELNDLIAMGFSQRVVEAIACLTHNQYLSYDDYIKKISYNELAKKVKIADLKHNSNLSRLDEITDDDIRRLNKYKKALEILLTK